MLITILISILSNEFADINANAQAEVGLFSFSFILIHIPDFVLPTLAIIVLHTELQSYLPTSTLSPLEKPIQNFQVIKLIN